MNQWYGVSLLEGSSYWKLFTALANAKHYSQTLLKCSWFSEEGR